MKQAKSIPKVSIRQIKAARALLDWSQEQLAVAAKISVPTIKRLEAQDGPLGGRGDTAAKISGALEKGGVEFINENGGGAGVRLKKPGVEFIDENGGGAGVRLKKSGRKRG